MTDLSDEEIRAIAHQHIVKRSMHIATWQWTRLDEAHPEVLALVQLQARELPVVSFFRSAASWYLLTTRRILGVHSGQVVELGAIDVVDYRVGDFKGASGRQTDVMTLIMLGGFEAQLEYETVFASMAPIQYLMFWRYKYPALEKLKADS